MDRAQSRWPRITGVVKELERKQAENHFGEMIANAYRERT